MNTLTRDQIRAIDQTAIEKFAIPGLVLMENAGRSAAEELLKHNPTGRITICCGKGNNGGDGLTIARHLLIAGLDVNILMFAPPEALKGDAATHFEITRRLKIPILEIGPKATPKDIATAFFGSSWIIDALLGTGVQGAPRPPFDAAIGVINTAAANGAHILAIDIPSGLDAEAGTPFKLESRQPAPCVRADLTTTFVARKTGFDNPASREFTAQVIVLGIGVPDNVIEAAIVSENREQ